VDTADPECKHSKKYVSQCEEGCGCNYVFLQCEDCDLHEMILGWDGCNVSWEFWVEEDVEHLIKTARSIRNRYDTR